MAAYDAAIALMSASRWVFLYGNHHQRQDDILVHMSPEGNRRPRPDWAEQDRFNDMVWIAENMEVFLPVAQAAYEELGRGAIMVDTTERPTGEGHPFGYFPQEQVNDFGDPDAMRMVAAYEPAWQFVIMLFKTEQRVSTYRIGVPSPGSQPDGRGEHPR